MGNGAAAGARDAKARTAPRRGGASREARRPSIAPYRNGTAPRERKKGRDRDIAPYRQGARGRRPFEGTRAVRTERGTRGRRGCAGKASRAGQAGCRILGAVLVLSGLSIEKSRSVFFGSFAEAIADGGFVQPVFGVSI